MDRTHMCTLLIRPMRDMIPPACVMEEAKAKVQKWDLIAVEAGIIFHSIL